MCLWRWRQMVQEHWLLPPGRLHQRYHKEEVGRRIQRHQQRQVVVLLMSGASIVCISSWRVSAPPVLSPEVVCSSFQHGLALWGSTWWLPTGSSSLTPRGTPPMMSRVSLGSTASDSTRLYLCTGSSPRWGIDQHLTRPCLLLEPAVWYII